MLRVTKGAAHDVPELTNAGKVADEVLVDTSQSTPQVGAIMVAEIEEVDGSMLLLVGKVRRSRARGHFTLRGTRFPEAAFKGTVVGAYFDMR